MRGCWCSTRGAPSSSARSATASCASFSTAVLRAPGFDPAALFTGAARFAGPLLEVGIEVPPTEDPFALRHALYWLTANVAAQRPLALIVDDAHWADSASLAVVSHIAHRLSGIPVAIVVASRVEASVDDLRGRAEAAGALLHLAPLGEQASAVLVRSVAPEVDDAACRACYDATGGNPFLLRELARSVLDGGAVAEQSPERVTREITARLAGMPTPRRAGWRARRPCWAAAPRCAKRRGWRESTPARRRPRRTR